MGDGVLVVVGTTLRIAFALAIADGELVAVDF